MSKYPKEHKLVLVGERGAGKLCLMRRYTEGSWPQEYDPTLEEGYRRLFSIGDEKVVVYMTAAFFGFGDYETPTVLENELRGCEGCLLVYSITDYASFQKLEVFHKRILSARGGNYFPTVVVGTKCDLEHERQVPSSEANAFATRIRRKHIEVSAMTGVNVDEAFMELVKLIRSCQEEKVLPIDTSRLPEESAGSYDKSHGCGCVIS